MKKYRVLFKFKNGKEMIVDTNSDVTTLPVVEINGTELIITEEQTAINLLLVESMEITELKQLN